MRPSSTYLLLCLMMCAVGCTTTASPKAAHHPSKEEGVPSKTADSSQKKAHQKQETQVEPPSPIQYVYASPIKKEHPDGSSPFTCSQAKHTTAPIFSGKDFPDLIRNPEEFDGRTFSIEFFQGPKQRRCALASQTPCMDVYLLSLSLKPKPFIEVDGIRYKFMISKSVQSNRLHRCTGPDGMVRVMGQLMIQKLVRRSDKHSHLHLHINVRQMGLW